MALVREADADELQVLVRDERDRTAAILRVDSLPLDGTIVWEIILRIADKKRSLEQNRRYWAVLREIAEQLEVERIDKETGEITRRRYASEIWHEHFKREFIGIEEIELPGGVIEKRGLTTTRLTVKAFAQYMTTIESYVTERGVMFHETRAYLEHWREQAAKLAP